MIVHEHEGLAGSKRLERAENQRVPLRRWDIAHVELDLARELLVEREIGLLLRVEVQANDGSELDRLTAELLFEVLSLLR